jgi:sulfite reductase (NADPH) flavoprotein alpha-component
MTTAAASVYNRNNPFYATVLERRLLTHPESRKETIHVILDITGSGLTFHCGDSVGIFPANDPVLVDAIVRLLRFDPLTLVTLPKKDSPVTFHEALTHYRCLGHPSAKMLQTLFPLENDAERRVEIERLLDPQHEARLRDWLFRNHILELIQKFPDSAHQIGPEGWIDIMRPLQPRLYSIANSPVAFPDQLHLTIGVIRFDVEGRKAGGVASTFFADRVIIDEEDHVPLFITHSHFKLPQNTNADVIMIGPGTGIAPFRGFMQERIATNAQGRNWLFFGNQYRKMDYLYEEEIEHWHQAGKLHRLDLAFSREQEEKVYVQHRLLEHAAEVWKWLQGGGCIYLCGDAKKMAPDVEEALMRIFQSEGNMAQDESKIFLQNLKKEKRYQRDVY